MYIDCFIFVLENLIILETEITAISYTFLEGNIQPSSLSFMTSWFKA